MSYFESRLRLNLENFEEIKTKFTICEKLGIKNLIIEPDGNLKYIGVELRTKIQTLTKINLYYRISLKPKNVEELKNNLNINRKLPIILSVETPVKEVQIQAAKDSRVDILSFPYPKIMKTLTSGVISLSKQNNSFIEISLSSIMISNKAQQSKYFRELYRIIQLVKSLKANLIISGNFEDPYHLRHPRTLISICHTLLGLSIVEAKYSFNENVKKLLERIEDKYDMNIIEDGIKFIKNGD